MTKFLVTYHAQMPAEDNMQSDPEEMKGVMDAWMRWGEQCGEGLVDMGSPVGKSKKVDNEGTSESSRMIAGFSILQAENMDEAMKMLEGHPHLQMPGAEIEVHEFLPLDM
mgnify:CR=1 FL=1